MIELKITGADGPELVAQLTSFAALLAGQGSTQPTTQPATTIRKRTAPAAEGKAEPNTADQPPEATDGAAPSRDDVAKKCTLYSQPTKGGLAGLKALFTKYGAPNGKWSEVSDEKLPALNAELDQLLA